MTVTWTPVQAQRLQELDAPEEQQKLTFENASERNKAFLKIEKELVAKGKKRLLELKNERKRPLLCELESKLVEALTKNDFVQVVTPIILSKNLLAKMTITEDHPLFSQVFWIDDKRCLRPMLAPNLYSHMKSLSRLWDKPYRIFEIGSCFRKESQGTIHLNEFTMLNLVEVGTPEEKRLERLKEFAEIVMDAVGITDYEINTHSSVVYGTTLDVECGIELGSGAMGPHKLDENWGIIDSWVGIGFGLERLAMVKEGGQNIQRMGKSLSYIDGVRLNI